MKITAIYNWLSINLERLVSPRAQWEIKEKHINRTLNRAAFRLVLKGYTLVVDCLVKRNGATEFIVKLFEQGRGYVDSFSSRLCELSDWVEARATAA